MADGDIAAIRIVWRACRRIATDDPSDDIIEETKPMGKKLNNNLFDLWYHRHHFRLSVKKVVTLVLTNKLYKHATSSPKQFTVLLPEEIKLRAVVSKQEKKLMTLEEIAEGKKAVGTKEDSVDPCLTHHIL